MQKKVLRAVVAFLVVLGLIFGQAAPGMASVPMNMEQSSMMAEIDSHHDTTSVSNSEHEDGCCSRADKNHTMKIGTCEACCVAACQAVMLPSHFCAPVLYEATQTYGVMNTSTIGKSVLPEPPYPKA